MNHERDNSQLVIDNTLMFLGVLQIGLVSTTQSYRLSSTRKIEKEPHQNKMNNMRSIGSKMVLYSFILAVFLITQMVEAGNQIRIQFCSS
jgi:hypothetical protein